MKLGFTDTDSFMYLLPCETNIYSKLQELDVGRLWMDFSNYPPSHPQYSAVNHLIPGKFKDEGAGSPFSEGVFLRAKMYSIRNIKSCLNKTTAKDISRSAKERYLKHINYVKTVQSPTVVSKLDIHRIVHSNHTLYTVKQTKSGLSAFNDKINIIKNNDEFIAHSFGYSP